MTEPASPWIVDVAEADFQRDVLDASRLRPVVVDFWAPWCGPCKWVSPLIDEVGRQHAGRLKVVRLDTDQAPAIAERYQVRGIPTLLVIQNGEEVDRIVGAVRRPELAQWLERHIGAPAA